MNCGVPQYSTDLNTQNPRNPRLSLAALQNRLATTDLQGLVEVWRSELHESRTSRAFAGCGTLKKYEEIPFEIDKNLKIECFWWTPGEPWTLVGNIAWPKIGILQLAASRLSWVTPWSPEIQWRGWNLGKLHGKTEPLVVNHGARRWCYLWCYFGRSWEFEAESKPPVHIPQSCHGLHWDVNKNPIFWDVISEYYTWGLIHTQNITNFSMNFSAQNRYVTSPREVFPKAIWWQAKAALDFKLCPASRLPRRNWKNKTTLLRIEANHTKPRIGESFRKPTSLV